MWADLHNAGETDRAAALWHPTSDDRLLPDGRVGLKIETVEEIERPEHVSADYSMFGVTALYWTVPQGGTYDEVHEMAFVLVRDDERQPWLIVSATDTGIVPTGR